MQAVNDRPVDRAARRMITLAILVGAALGALVGVPRYGLLDFSTVALMGLGTMVTLGSYAIWVAVRPPHPLDEPDADSPPPP